ncbi:site-specific integrase [Pseudomonas plecoglossicida]|uniref:site-specific integrase n=1 Tax=Pseudomonas TaxID=286 RepID=UPI0002F590D7|nr:MULTISPECIES: site-specific integrase [Pseudomonas]AHD15297.1 integrase [Pseudomonas sp. FGI182]MCE0942051.1 site-specific integrase [Pseudomonas asiatica]MCE0953150.1 site-specific integrase [Pseudomonas asiatica]MCE1062483.1 site-specific integrase [Pseudomonas asiatica]MCE1097804.1 site-specific integrase [Pseudomonas asiatica]
MAAGVEVRGNHVRVYFRYQGELCRETIPGDASPANLANAERLVGIINYEIEAGTFNYARHFPDSPRVKTNTLGHYIDLWLEIKGNQMAASGFAMYRSRTEKHIRPRWGDQQADRIDHLDIQHWVQSVLMPKLHNKTVREIVSHLRQIFQLYRTRNRFAFDPTDGITISLPDADDPDPFTREEINAILEQQTERQQEINLTEFMIWTGPRVSEAIALAWEDVDLVAGTVEIRRARVAGQYKVTKTRRSTRKVKLLAPALRALQAQAKFTQHIAPELIEVVDRDNRTVREQRVRFVFHNSATGEPYRSSDVLRHGWWITHLEKAGVRQRGPNTCRHTFASQMLSSGIATPEWIADQMGHTSTAMIFKHYAKWISEDGPDVVGLLNQALRLT